jgi:hypothetical protein
VKRCYARRGTVAPRGSASVASATSLAVESAERGEGCAIIILPPMHGGPENFESRSLRREAQQAKPGPTYPLQASESGSCLPISKSGPPMACAGEREYDDQVVAQSQERAQQRTRIRPRRARRLSFFGFSFSVWSPPASAMGSTAMPARSRARGLAVRSLSLHRLWSLHRIFVFSPLRHSTLVCSSSLF